ncbi:Zn-ribbon domain-containing OB-fold protein [Roseivivax sp.]
MLQRDPESGQAVFPPRLRAPGGQAPLEDWQEMSGRGTVHSVTLQHRREGPPRVIALVDLAEGGRMLSRLTGAGAEDIAIGAPVRARIAREAEVPHVVFEPEGEAP